MSTIVFVSQDVPDKKLQRETKYKYVPDKEMRSKVIDDLKNNAKVDIPDNMIVEFDFRISLKEYDFTYKPTDKNKCYQEYSNTKTAE